MITLNREGDLLKRLPCLIVIIFVSFVSLGAWWDFGKSKKEKLSENKELHKEVISPKISETENSVLPAAKTEEPSVAAKPQAEVKTEKLAEHAPKTKSAKKSEKKSDAKAGKLYENREEVEKVQDELKDIISRTQQLQGQVQGNRVEIQNILQRAQIHERILRSIAVPAPVRLKSQVDAEELIKHEKVRIIAEQTQKTQQQLRAIQQVQSAAKTVKTS